MSVQSITPAIPIPPPPVLPVETKPLDVTTAAVLQYLGGDPDALEHLIAICFRAAKGLWLVVLDGHERETRTWVEDWLLDFLHPFRAISMAALIEAADADTFRYIGRRCKFAIIDELRRRSAARRPAIPSPV